GDDALVGIDVAGQTVEQGRLARTRAAGDHDVAADTADDLQQDRAFRRDRPELDELLEGELVLLELTDGQRRSIDRKRRGDDVDARAVRKAGVADRRRFIDTPADLADDPLADGQKLRIVAEPDFRFDGLAADFDEGLARAIHHDVGDVVARQERLQGAVAENVVADILEQFLLL